MERVKKMTDGFPARLQRLRERQHKSRKVLSELCGLHPDAVRKYERGEMEPSVASMRWILPLLSA